MRVIRKGVGKRRPMKEKQRAVAPFAIVQMSALEMKGRVSVAGDVDSWIARTFAPVWYYDAAI